MRLTCRKWAIRLLIVLTMMARAGEARWTGIGGGGRAPVNDPKSSFASLGPEQLEEAAKKVRLASWYHLSQVA